MIHSMVFLKRKVGIDKVCSRRTYKGKDYSGFERKNAMNCDDGADIILQSKQWILR